MSNKRSTGKAAAHSASEPQRASDYQSRLKQAQKEMDDEAESAFFFMLCFLQKIKAPAEYIETLSMYHTNWKLRKVTVNILREAVAS